MAEGPTVGPLAPAAQLGRYFGNVAGFPTLIAALLPLAIVAAGAPAQRPQFSTALAVLQRLRWSEVGLLAVVIVAVGLILHPLQFGLTQLLEGYWGARPLARRAMTRSIRVHTRRFVSLDDLAQDTSWKAGDVEEAVQGIEDLEVRLAEADELDESVADGLRDVRLELLLQHAELRASAQEAQRLLDKYPKHEQEIMPTRLGNVLRRYERLAGYPYGLDAILTTGLLAQVAPETLREYHDDARTDLDVAVRLVLTWAACTVVTFTLLWPFDVWLAIPLATLAFAWLAYRGAVASAEAYGEALIALHALGRPSLYQALQLPTPRSSDEELRQNELLTRQLQGERVSLPYRHVDIE